MQLIDTYLLDLDGVVFRGDQLLPGAAAFVAWLEAQGCEYRYVSNNSMQGPDAVAARLRRLGIPTPDWRVVTASQAAVRTLAQRFPGAPVWILGLAPLRELAASAGLHVLNRRQTDRPDDPAAGATTARAVLVGLDRDLTYEGLRLAARAVLAGAELIGVNRDMQLPVEDGFDPGCGAILAALEVATRQPATIVGKPAPGILLEALAEMHRTPDRAVMVGDAIEMDIVAGQAAGMATYLLLSGLTTAERAAHATPTPTRIARDLADLLQQLRPI